METDGGFRGSEAAVADVGELGLEPLDAAADGGLDPALRGEHVVSGDAAAALGLRVVAGAGPVEAVRLAGLAAAAAGDVLVVVPAAAAVVVLPYSCAKRLQCRSQTKECIGVYV